MTYQLIEFKELSSQDLKLMYKWLNKDFVMEWYSKKTYTIDDINKKYFPIINKEKPIVGYIILLNTNPIGYIQKYTIHDFEEDSACVNVNEKAATFDIFIGEKDYLHKGLGKYIIQKFLKELIFVQCDIESCIIGCEITNFAASKAYNKVGFKQLKMIETSDVREYILKIGKEVFYKNKH